MLCNAILAEAAGKETQPVAQSPGEWGHVRYQHTGVMGAARQLASPQL